MAQRDRGGEIGHNSVFGGNCRVDLWLSLKDSPLVCVRHLTLSNRGLIKQSIFGRSLANFEPKTKACGKAGDDNKLPRHVLANFA